MPTETVSHRDMAMSEGPPKPFYIESMHELLSKRNMQAPNEPIDGNIYRYWAFGFQSSSKFTTLTQIAVVTIQVLAPIAIFIDMFGRLHVECLHIGLREWVPPEGRRPVVHVLQRLLAFLFLAGFVANAARMIATDGRQSARAKWLVRVVQFRLQRANLDLDAFNKQLKQLWFKVDATVNGLSMFVSCLDLLLIMSADSSPRDVVFDAMSLLFIFNLDDIGGGLGLLGYEDWPAQELGNFLLREVTLMKASSQKAFMTHCEQHGGVVCNHTLPHAAIPPQEARAPDYPDDHAWTRCFLDPDDDYVFGYLFWCKVLKSSAVALPLMFAFVEGIGGRSCQ